MRKADHGPRRPPGPRPSTGNCATRQELEANVRWMYQATSCSMDRIAKHYGVSQRTVAAILNKR